MVGAFNLIFVVLCVTAGFGIYPESRWIAGFCLGAAIANALVFLKHD